MFSFTFFLILLLSSYRACGFHRSVVLSYKLLSRSKISHSAIADLSSKYHIDGNNDSNESIVKKDDQTSNIVSRFDIVLRALVHYKIRHHSLLVPQRFIIPIDSLDWPEDVWGLRLGNIVRKIRKGQSFQDRRDDLIKIGFSFDIFEDKYDTVKLALLRYKDLHGDMLVPVKFQIDANNDWPQVTWTLKLGQIVNDIRLKKVYEQYYDELLSIGFCYDLLQAKFELIMTALVRYHELTGNLLVSRKFLVPHNSDEWPVRSWGLRLGYYVDQIRAGEIYNDKLEDLKGIGFDLDSAFYNSTKETVWKPQLKFNQTLKIYSFDDVKLAMLEFKTRIGHLVIPKNFIIPNQSESLSTTSWSDQVIPGMDSVISGMDLVNPGTDLVNLGTDLVNPGTDLVNPGTDLVISETDPVTSEMDHIGYSPSWPEVMWGMHLGKISSDCRKGLIHTDKRDELVLIGLPMIPQVPVYDYELLRSAFVRYSRLYGDLDLPSNFVVPVKNKDWPKETWGMMLGAIARGIRKGEYYVDKKEDLIAIGFEYKIVTYKLVKSALLRYKDLNYHMLVPHRFIVPKVKEWRENMWGLKLGDIVGSVRCKGLYRDKKEELSSLGFNYEVTDKGPLLTYGEVKSVLTLYKRLYGLDIPEGYKVGYGDSNFREETWGMPLGKIFKDIKDGLKWPEKRAELMS